MTAADRVVEQLRAASTLAVCRAGRALGARPGRRPGHLAAAVPRAGTAGARPASTPAPVGLGPGGAAHPRRPVRAGRRRRLRRGHLEPAGADRPDRRPARLHGTARRASRSCSPAGLCAGRARPSGWWWPACSRSTSWPPGQPGWPGWTPSDWRGTSALVGGALLALGVGVGAWSRSQPVRRVYGAEVVAAVGVLAPLPGQRLAGREPGDRHDGRDPAAGGPGAARCDESCR